MAPPPADRFSERQSDPDDGDLPAVTLPAPRDDGHVDEEMPATGPRRRRLVLWLGAAAAAVLLAGGLLAAYWLRGGSKYEAHAQLHVAREQPRVLADVFPGHRDSDAEFESYRRTQATMIKSRLVLNAALQEPSKADDPDSTAVGNLKLLKDQPDPFAWLEAHLLADYSAGPEILTVSLSGNDPSELVAVVNGVTRAYLREVVDKEQQDRFAVLDKLKAILTNIELRLRDKKKALRAVAEMAGANDPANLSVKQRLALEQLAASQREFTDLKSELRRLSIEAAAEGTTEVKVPGSVLSREVEKDPLVQKYQARETELEERLDEIARTQPKDGQVLAQKTRSELDSVRQALEERRKRVRAKVEPRLREQLADEARDRASQREARRKYLMRLQTQLEEEINSLAGDTHSLNKKGLDMEDLRKEVVQKEEIASRIGMQAEILSVNRDAPPRVRLIESATVRNLR
jgi:hypothetical protein